MRYQNYHIAASQAARNAPETPKKLYYKATVYHIGIVGPMADDTSPLLMISSQPDAKGDTCSDDTVLITMELQNGNSVAPVSYFYDYSDGCSRSLQPLAPFNLCDVEPKFADFQGHEVKVTVECSDKCGSLIGSTDFYLCVGA